MNDERKIPTKYLPKSLTQKDRAIQYESIREQRIRPKVSSFTSRPSKWTRMARNFFGDNNTSKIDMAKILSMGNKEKEKELFKGMDLIVKKGEKAYFTSGSRPNQTPQSWGMARLFSVLFGGPSRNIDKDIVKKYNIPLLKQTGGNKPDDDCPICLEEMEPLKNNIIYAHRYDKEKHYFHFDCLARYNKTSGSWKCPLCRKEIDHKIKENGIIGLYGPHFLPFPPPPPPGPPPPHLDEEGKEMKGNGNITTKQIKRRYRVI